MEQTHTLYTLGNWTVKSGNEVAFIAEWKRFADWSANHCGGAGTAYLLQDVEHPHMFISYGPWDNADAIKAWRGTPEFQAFVGSVRRLCENFVPHSMKLAATSIAEQPSEP